MQQPLEDLGAKFCRDRNFYFDHIIIHEIIFDESYDVTLFCTVPYFGMDYSANFGLTFDQLDFVLRHTNPAGKEIAAAIAGKLKGDIEIPSVIELDLIYGQPLEVTNCIFDTTLYDFTGEDQIGEEEEKPEQKPEEPRPKFNKDEPGLGDYEESDEEDDDEEEESYAFLIEDIWLRPEKRS
jgi:hypothetical protein